MALTDEDKKWISEELSDQLQLQLQAFEVKVSERLESVETRLLTEFHKWASPAEIRQRSQREALHALEIDVESLKDRLKALEDRPHGKA